jgi:hypothetical protein
MNLKKKRWVFVFICGTAIFETMNTTSNVQVWRWQMN